jgi:hypothetical protein
MKKREVPSQLLDLALDLGLRQNHNSELCVCSSDDVLFEDDNASVQFAFDRGYWLLLVGPPSPRSGDLDGVPEVRSLVDGGAPESMSRDEQIEYVSTAWRRIGQIYAPPRRQETLSHIYAQRRTGGSGRKVTEDQLWRASDD